MSEPRATVSISARVLPETRDQLKQIAEHDGDSMSRVLEDLIYERYFIIFGNEKREE